MTKWQHKMPEHVLTIMIKNEILIRFNELLIRN